MNLIYRSCVIAFILNDYVTGNSENEISGNILSESDSEDYSDTNQSDEITETETDSDVEASDTNGNETTELLDVERVNVYQWQKGIVPYFIETKIYDKIIVDRIYQSMEHIKSISCLQFKRLHSKPNPSDYGINWLHINNPSKERNCVHSIKQGNLGQPTMVLGFDCMREADITHSLLHMLGFNDEVQHPQRDSYVRIQWDNIQPKYRSLFAIRYVPTPYHTLTEYDAQSIMHFHDRAYSINGGATIAPLIPGLLIGPSDKLSVLDKMKLHLAFGHECNKRNVDNILMSCKNALLEEGKDKDVTADNDINGIIASDSDGSTANESDKGTANESDKGTANESDKGTANGTDVGVASGSDAGGAKDSDGGNASGSDKSKAATPQRLIWMHPTPRLNWLYSRPPRYNLIHPRLQV